MTINSMHFVMIAWGLQYDKNINYRLEQTRRQRRWLKCWERKRWSRQPRMIDEDNAEDHDNVRRIKDKNGNINYC